VNTWMHTVVMNGAAGVLLAASALWTTVGADSHQTPTAAASDACAVLPPDEVGKALGVKISRARPSQEQAGTACRYQGGMMGSINFSLNPSTSKKDFDEFRKLLVDQGEKPEPVAGVGDDAYFWGTRIYARVGNRSLAIWNGEPSVPAAKVKGDMLALAKVAVQKLR
jgi:hypothetical protein